MPWFPATCTLFLHSISAKQSIPSAVWHLLTSLSYLVCLSTPPREQSTAAGPLVFFTPDNEIMTFSSQSNVAAKCQNPQFSLDSSLAMRKDKDCFIDCCCLLGKVPELNSCYVIHFTRGSSSSPELEGNNSNYAIVMHFFVCISMHANQKVFRFYENHCDKMWPAVNFKYTTCTVPKSALGIHPHEQYGRTMSNKES